MLFEFDFDMTLGSAVENLILCVCGMCRQLIFVCTCDSFSSSSLRTLCVTFAVDELLIDRYIVFIGL